jgi:DNA-binding IclR family transcriptional regulator
VVAAESLPAAPVFGDAPQYPIESVDNALKVLWLLGQRPSLRLTDVSEYLEVASSSAHRLLATLQYRGLVRQDRSNRTYGPGPALDDLAFGVLRRLDVRNRARPVLEQLNADLAETVHLGRLDGADVHFIDSIESTRALRVGNRLGRAMPANCTSTGKALLATLTDQEVVRLFPDEALPTLTPNSIATRSKLLKELAQIRVVGYATSQEESEEGVSSFAMAVRGTRSPQLAVNASVPRSRATAAHKREILERLRVASEEIDLLLL